MIASPCSGTSARRVLALEGYYEPGPVDDGFFAPLDQLRLAPGTALYLGLIHFDDAAGDRARLAAARRHVHVDGIATECGMARGDPARLAGLLAAHVRAAELPVGPDAT